MRYFLSLIILTATLANAQQIDTATVSHAEKLIGINFTEAEKDSMTGWLQTYRDQYKKLHEQPTPNSLSYPFAFHPEPPGFKIPTKQLPVNWYIPANVSLPTNKNDLAFFSIPQLASLLKYKKISSFELTKFFLDRLKKWGDTLECVITLTEDLALQQARQADAEISKGQWRGPLHGIPYGLKDLFAVKGYKTTWGSVPYKDQVIDEDAFVYTQLKKAGAVLVAKLTLGELANMDQWFGGRTRNPWDLTRGAGGSSAGSGSATAAGLVPYAIGTETWGSIITPAHRCGATGLRPTFGSVGRSGGMVLAWSLDKPGPICRSAEDAAIVFYYMKGADDKDASSVDRAFNYTGKADLKKLRIAYAGNYFNRLSPQSMQWSVLKTFRDMGANLQEVQFPDSTIYPYNMVNIVISAESAAAFDELTRSNRDDLIRRQDKNYWPNTFRMARFIPAVEYINTNRHRSVLIEKVNAFMKNYDVIITPSFVDNQMAITNLTGHPALVMPIGFTTDTHLPNSITLIGNLYDEATILAVAKAFQDTTNHNKQHPDKFRN